MNELIKIEQKDGIETVDARELHEFLRVGKDFSNWIKDRVAKYGFTDGEDFITCTPKLASEIHGGQNRIDYYLSIDMAKELSMVENNEQGRKARRYFIEMEKIVKTRPSIRDKSKKIRNHMTDIWKLHGATAPRHFINLTYTEYKVLGYEKPRGTKKDEMTKTEIARLAALESLEILKLETRPETKGYYELRDSLSETGSILEQAEKLMNQRTELVS